MTQIPIPKKNIFLVIGHGSEDLVNFSKRTKVPYDKVIVSFAICGRVNFMQTCCRIASMMNRKEHTELLSNPIRNKDAIEKLFDLLLPMRIYLPNEYVPQLSTNLFLDFHDFEKEEMVIMKSGVYRINDIPPIDRDILPGVKTVGQKLGTSFCTPFIGLLENPSKYTQAVHNEVFKGNLYEPALTKGKNFRDYQLNRTFTLADITNTVGKGIYYYIGCRSLNPHYDMKIYDNIFSASDNQQRATGRTPKIEQVVAAVDKSVYKSKTKTVRPSTSQPTQPAVPALLIPQPTPPTVPILNRKIIPKQRQTLNRRRRVVKK